MNEEQLNNEEFKIYKQGCIDGLEYALKLVRYNRDQYGDMDVNKAWIEAHREIRVSIEASLERIKKNQPADSTSSTM